MPLATAPAGPAGTASPPSRVAAMPAERFRVLVLGIVALAAALAAEGVQSFAEMRARHLVVVSRLEASSPLAYGAAAPALHSLAPGALAVVVRVDSAGGQSAALCELARHAGADPAVRWVALGGEVDGCVRSRLGGRIGQGTSGHAAEMRDARWIVLGEGGTALHSRRTVPAEAELRETLALLAPVAEPAP
jgi:hypothetical protein